MALRPVSSGLPVVASPRNFIPGCSSMESATADSFSPSLPGYRFGRRARAFFARKIPCLRLRPRDLPYLACECPSGKVLPTGGLSFARFPCTTPPSSCAAPGTVWQLPSACPMSLIDYRCNAPGDYVDSGAHFPGTCPQSETRAVIVAGINVHKLFSLFAAMLPSPRLSRCFCFLELNRRQ